MLAGAFFLTLAVGCGVHDGLDCLRSSRPLNGMAVRLLDRGPTAYEVEYRLGYGQRAAMFSSCPITQHVDSLTVRVPEDRCDGYVPMLLNHNNGLVPIESAFSSQVSTQGNFRRVAPRILAAATPAGCPIVLELRREPARPPIDNALVVTDSAGEVHARRTLPTEDALENPEKTRYAITQPFVAILEFPAKVVVSIWLFFGMLFAPA